MLQQQLVGIATLRDTNANVNLDECLHAVDVDEYDEQNIEDTDNCVEEEDTSSKITPKGGMLLEM